MIKKEIKLIIFLSIFLLLIISVYLKEIETKISNEFLIQKMEQRYDKLEELISNTAYIPVMIEVTAYAPLDPRAVEGMCFSGDPRTTASGLHSMPGRSIAMGQDFAYGTEVYVPSLGFNGVNMDRGSAIGNKNIDLMVETKYEANKIGRKIRLVFIKIN